MMFRRLIYKDSSFYKKVLGISVPIALQSLITTGVNVMDTIMIGAVGETQLSAVSLANQFINIYHILCMGIGMGASVLVARFFGMGEQKAVRKTIAIMLRFCLGIATLFCLVTAAAPHFVMRIYTEEKPIIAEGIVYLKWSVITYYLLGLSLTCTIVLRNVGKTTMPLYTSIGAFFLNVGANYIFIFGKLGMPAMGVAGAALGTLVARIFECGVICGFLFFREDRIAFRIPHLFMQTGDLVREYVRISVPVLISDGILAFGNSAVAMVVGRLGSSFVAANAITISTQQLSNVMTQGFSQAGAIVTGNTLGEGKTEQAQEQGYAFLGLGIGFGMLAALIITAISGPMIRAYNISADTAQIAKQLMIAISIIILFQSTNSILTKGVLRGGGDTKMLMLTDNVFLWVISIPLGILAGFVLKLPAFWIYICLKIDQIIKAVWCVFRLRSGKWIKKISTGSKSA